MRRRRWMLVASNPPPNLPPGRGEGSERGGSWGSEAGAGSAGVADVGRSWDTIGGVEDGDGCGQRFDHD